MAPLAILHGFPTWNKAEIDRLIFTHLQTDLPWVFNKDIPLRKWEYRIYKLIIPYQMDEQIPLTEMVCLLYNLNKNILPNIVYSFWDGFQFKTLSWDMLFQAPIQWHEDLLFEKLQIRSGDLKLIMENYRL